ncbi:hypothetical protein D3C81_1310050 [compost metagenome]
MQILCKGLFCTIIIQKSATIGANPEVALFVLDKFIDIIIRKRFGQARMAFYQGKQQQVGMIITDPALICTSPDNTRLIFVQTSDTVVRKTTQVITIMINNLYTLTFLIVHINATMIGT